MSKIIISHSTAFLLYRKYRIMQHQAKSIDSSKYNKSILNECLKEILEEIKENQISKLDVLVFQKEKSHAKQNIHFHCWTGNLPLNYLISINDKYSVVCPEFLFCLFANSLSYVRLFQVGLEMCGTYVIDKSSEYGFLSSVQVLSSANKINKFAQLLKKAYPNFRAHARVFEVIKAISNLSASPQESRLYIMLCGSRKIGAYGLKNFYLNQTISISSEAKIIAGQKEIKSDLVNKRTKIVIEYDSNTFHDSFNQNNKDKRRLDALTYDGWKTISVVPDQLKSVETFDKIARYLLTINGQEKRIRRKGFEQKTNSLFKLLYTYQ